MIMTEPLPCCTPGARIGFVPASNEPPPPPPSGAPPPPLQPLPLLAYRQAGITHGLAAPLLRVVTVTLCSVRLLRPAPLGQDRLTMTSPVTILINTGPRQTGICGSPGSYCDRAEVLIATCLNIVIMGTRTAGSVEKLPQIRLVADPRRCLKSRHLTLSLVKLIAPMG